MSCTCKDAIRVKLQEKYPDAESIEGMYDLISGCSYTEYEIRREGKKKHERVAVFHTHCPHCGAEYGEEVPHDDE